MTNFNVDATNSQPKKALKTRNTKTAAQKAAERQAICADRAEGINPRETKHRLKLTPDQYSRHITAAFDAGELSQQPGAVNYAVIRVGALQPEDRIELRKRLQLDVSDSSLLKFEKRNDEIICSIIGAETNLSEEGSDE
jgi:hypothetical protein